MGAIRGLHPAWVTSRPSTGSVGAVFGQVDGVGGVDRREVGWAPLREGGVGLEVGGAAEEAGERGVLASAGGGDEVAVGSGDGPLALDNAISPQAAAIKKINSPVAGRANVLVVPDLEAGNMLAKSLSFLADADAAGIVLGAKVPIILTSRADEEMARLASCAVAQLLVAARKADASAAVR